MKKKGKNILTMLFDFTYGQHVKIQAFNFETFLIFRVRPRHVSRVSWININVSKLNYFWAFK